MLLPLQKLSYYFLLSSHAILDIKKKKQQKSLLKLNQESKLQMMQKNYMLH